VEHKGTIYHVTVRAKGGADLFQDDVVRRYLLKRIAEAAMALGLRTGVAVSCQLRRLAQLLGTDEALRRLDKEQRKVEH